MAAAAAAVFLSPSRPLPSPLNASPRSLPSSTSFLPSPVPMGAFSRLRRLPVPRLRRGLPSLAVVSAAVRQEAATWAQAPLTLVRPAADDGSLFHVAVDVSDHSDLAAAFTVPGQYLQLRVPNAPKPVFLAMASPPALATFKGVFEFLVKSVPGSTSELLCGMGMGDVVELSGVMGKGFEVDRFSPPEAISTVLLFATGSGISPIRSLIESGFDVKQRSDVRLYYGARNLQRMAYQDKFGDWKSSGIKVIPVLSRPEVKWKGEHGYVQAAFNRVKQILTPSSTGAVLCGHRQMMEDITSVLVADGVSQDNILKNF